MKWWRAESDGSFARSNSSVVTHQRPRRRSPVSPPLQQQGVSTRSYRAVQARSSSSEQDSRIGLLRQIPSCPRHAGKHLRLIAAPRACCWAREQAIPLGPRQRGTGLGATAQLRDGGWKLSFHTPSCVPCLDHGTLSVSGPIPAPSEAYLGSLRKGMKKPATVKWRANHHSAGEASPADRLESRGQITSVTSPMMRSSAIIPPPGAPRSARESSDTAR